MKKLVICSWNVNGIRAAHSRGNLGWFAELRPDILCLQETKASEEQLPPDLREVEGYNAYFNSPERKGYSGVALYSRSRPLSVKGGFGEPRFDGEGRTLIAEYDGFVLFNIYFPNGKQSKERLKFKMDFYDAFLALSLIHISEPTRLLSISYAVFCLKKKKKTHQQCDTSPKQVS